MTISTTRLACILGLVLLVCLVADNVAKGWAAVATGEVVL